MPPPSLQPAPRHPKRWRRVLLWVLGSLFVLELLPNVLLATGLLEAVLSGTPERMSVHWRRAWSPWPGHIRIRELTLRRREADGVHWQLSMESADVNLSLTALLKRRFEAESLLVRGLGVRIQPGPLRPGERASEDAVPARPWLLRLRGVRVHEVHELVVGDHRLTGVREATGEMELEPGHRLTVRDARARLGEGQLTRDEEVLARIEEGLAECGIDAPRAEPGGGLDFSTGLNGRLQATATLPSLTALRRWVPQLAEASLKGGAGRLEVDVRVEKGQLAPDSRLEGAGRPLTVSLGPLRVEAPWRLHGKVRAGEGGSPLAGLRLVLAPVRVEGREGQLLETSEVTVALGAKAPRLGEPLHDLRGELLVARSDPLDLRLLNPWIGQTCQVESGQVSLEASTRVQPGAGEGAARLELRTEALQARWGGALLSGHVIVDVDARTLALRGDRVSLEGTRLLLRDITVQTAKDDARGWDGTLSFPEATLSLSPPALEGRFVGSFSNAAPFIALLADKGGLPHALSPLLQAQGLELSGHMTLGNDGARVKELHATGKGLELRGQVESTRGATRAVLLVKVGPVPLGVEVMPEGTSFQLLSPYDWFEKQRKVSERESAPQQRLDRP